ncbi:hypothetical protein [Fulvitalea axinellae]
MVRVKGDVAVQNAIDDGYFNSTMVRVKAKVKAKAKGRKSISIPLWCE